MSQETPKETPKEIPEFYLDDKPLEWPVIVKLPQDGGTHAAFRFTGKFARLSGDEIDKLTQRDELSKRFKAALDANDGPALEEGQKEMRKVAKQAALVFLVGWGDEVKTARGGSPVPFTREALEAQLAGPKGDALADAIMTAMGQIRNGVAVGNSETLPATGQQPAPETEEPTL